MRAHVCAPSFGLAAAKSAEPPSWLSWIMVPDATMPRPLPCGTLPSLTRRSHQWGLHSAEHQPESGHLVTDAGGRLLLVLHSSAVAQAVAIRLPPQEAPRALPEVLAQPER